ncbi:flagellar assembly protein FliH [Aneurinibacillus terranovensis]|uniref:flagellar assembly protein FliH n=1 Tax=Aneurinibacillus terranovensis TaxID=278991 RepID=UPI000409C4E0|nr:flagellar assembly protein FliH [Aneurinibacillus terranovensis]
MSRIIKSSFYSTIEDAFTLRHRGNMAADHNVGSVDEPGESEAAESTGNSAGPDSISAQANEIIQRAKAEAERIIFTASQQADQIMNESRLEMDQWWQQRRQEDEAVREQARQEGFRQGTEEGRKEGERLAYEEYTSALNHAREILEEAPHIKRRIVAEAEPFLLDLTMEIAKKVIGAHLSLHQESVLEIIRHSLSYTQEYKTIVVCVSPESYEYVQENRKKVLEILDSQIEMTIVPDHSVSEGGCIIRTSMGSVDARVDTQLEEIRKNLFSICNGNGELTDAAPS